MTQESGQNTKKDYLRWSVLAASLLLITTYFFPLWEIDLWAPQYPEGLGMQIWINKMTGALQSINILNHYIGMKHITPADFPELKFFPLAIAGLVTLGLLCAAIGHRFLLWSWSALLLVGSSAAFVDFYLWQYKFSHELSPDAAIKMEGVTYQPPLIGSKTILNITASSMPGIAGYALFLSVALVVGALAFNIVNARKKAL